MQQEETEKSNDKLQEEVKRLEQENGDKEHMITSLAHQKQLAEAKVDELDRELVGLKAAAEESKNLSEEIKTLRGHLDQVQQEADELEKARYEINSKYDQGSCITAYMPETSG